MGGWVCPFKDITLTTANMRAVPPTGGILDTPYLKVWVAPLRAYAWTVGVGGLVGDRLTEWSKCRSPGVLQNPVRRISILLSISIQLRFQ